MRVLKLYPLKNTLAYRSHQQLLQRVWIRIEAFSPTVANPAGGRMDNYFLHNHSSIASLHASLLAVIDRPFEDRHLNAPFQALSFRKKGTSPLMDRRERTPEDWVTNPAESAAVNQRGRPL